MGMRKRLRTLSELHKPQNCDRIGLNNENKLLFHSFGRSVCMSMSDDLKLFQIGQLINLMPRYTTETLYLLE